MRTVRNRLVAFAISLACTLAVAACGSASSPNAGKSPASGTSSSAAPITLMALGPVDAPGFSLPSIPVGAQIAINEINSAGGVNGHPLKLITCNELNNPNTAVLCARQAIEDKVTALVGGFSVYAPQFVPLLAQADIPWVGTVSPVYTSANVFPIAGDASPSLFGIGLALAKQGCKRIADIVSAAGPSAGYIQTMDAGIRAGGVKLAGAFTIPVTSTDLAPTVAAARSAGADCIASGLGPSQSAPLIAAVNATGQKLTIAFNSGGLPDEVLQQLGKAANGVLAISGYLPSSSTEGAVQQLKQKMQAQYPKVPLDQFAEAGYAAVEVVAQAAKGLKDVTASSLESALTKVKGFDTGLGPVIDFSKPNPTPGYERLFNTKVFVYVAKNGVFYLAQPEPIDTTPALRLLAGK